MMELIIGADDILFMINCVQIVWPLPLLELMNDKAVAAGGGMNGMKVLHYSFCGNEESTPFSLTHSLTHPLQVDVNNSS